jgi:hypothetical protein
MKDIPAAREVPVIRGEGTPEHQVGTWMQWLQINPKLAGLTKNNGGIVLARNSPFFIEDDDAGRGTVHILAEPEEHLARHVGQDPLWERIAAL